MTQQANQVTSLAKPELTRTPYFSLLGILCFIIGPIFGLIIASSGSGWAAGYKALVTGYLTWGGFLFSGLCFGCYSQYRKEKLSWYYIYY